MTVTYGADPSQLRELGTTLRRQVDEIDQILSAGSAVETTNWVGPAREAFLDQWTNSFKVALDNLRGAFESAGHECMSRADGLEAVMGVGG